jgi:hypothetical protein
LERELKGVDGLLLHLRHGRQSFLFFFFSSAAELLCTTSSSSPASPPRADWGGRRRSAEVFCPTALIPTDISFLISRPLSLQSRCFFSCSVWVRFFFFRERRRTHAGWPDEFHVHLL